MTILAPFPLCNANLTTVHIHFVEANTYEFTDSNSCIEQDFDQDHISEFPPPLEPLATALNVEEPESLTRRVPLGRHFSGMDSQGVLLSDTSPALSPFSLVGFDPLS